MLLISFVAQLCFPVFGSIGIGMSVPAHHLKHSSALEYVMKIDLGPELVI